jgi:hypothetical protein
MSEALMVKIIVDAIRRADRRWTATPMNPHEDGDIILIEARRAASEIEALTASAETPTLASSPAKP